MDHAIPYEDLDESIVMSDLKKTQELLSRTIKEPNTVRAYLLATEPFNRYPKLIENLYKEE
jgi:ABC-type lipoprotein release transport system permease subunit